MSDLNELSRRSLLKRTAGMMALAIGGGTPFLSSRAAWAQSADLAKQSLRTIGLSVTVQERILADFKALGRGDDVRHGGDLSGRADQDPIGFEGL